MSHACPRPECSRTVPDDLFACRPDWYALPSRLRDAIWSAFRDGEGTEPAAMAEAIAWYHANPPRAARDRGRR